MTTRIRFSQRQFKSPPVLHVHTETFRSLQSVVHQIPRHLCLHSVPPSAKCAMTKVNWHHAALYCHKIPSRSWISSVPKLCTSCLKRQLSVTATESYMITSVVSVVADTELYLHKTEIRRSHKQKNTLPLTRKTRADWPTDKCPGCTDSCRNSTTRTTGSVTCTIAIGTYTCWENWQTG